LVAEKAISCLYIEFRDMLPKSKVGKLLRREIRDEEKRRVEA
jgi:long-chain acyl-CoA synthetase